MTWVEWSSRHCTHVGSQGSAKKKKGLVSYERKRAGQLRKKKNKTGVGLVSKKKKRLAHLLERGEDGERTERNSCAL